MLIKDLKLPVLFHFDRRMKRDLDIALLIFLSDGSTIIHNKSCKVLLFSILINAIDCCARGCGFNFILTCGRKVIWSKNTRSKIAVTAGSIPAEGMFPEKLSPA